MINKPIIYQLFPRLFGNYNDTRKRYGTKEENGCGRFVDINERALQAIVELGATHVWYTGVIRHATAEYNNPAITKALPVRLMRSPITMTSILIWPRTKPNECRNSRN